MPAEPTVGCVVVVKQSEAHTYTNSQRNIPTQTGRGTYLHKQADKKTTRGEKAHILMGLSNGLMKMGLCAYERLKM